MIEAMVILLLAWLWQSLWPSLHWLLEFSSWRNTTSFEDQSELESESVPHDMSCCTEDSLCEALVENLRQGNIFAYTDSEHPLVIVLKGGDSLVVLNFCPFCGTELQTIIKNYPFKKLTPRLVKKTDNLVH